MTKRRTAPPTFKHKSSGYNKKELEQTHPEVANAFMLILSKYKSTEPDINTLWKKYTGRYKNQHGNVRKIPLTKILDVLKDKGLVVTYTVTDNGKSIKPEDSFEFLTPYEILCAYLNKEQTGLKQYSWGGRRYRNAVYLYDEHFYSCVREGDDWTKPDMKGAVPIEWERVKTVFDRYGFQVLRCKAELKYFVKAKQVIRYSE
jgi:hypothetical protein